MSTLASNKLMKSVAQFCLFRFNTNCTYRTSMGFFLFFFYAKTRSRTDYNSFFKDSSRKFYIQYTKGWCLQGRRRYTHHSARRVQYLNRKWKTFGCYNFIIPPLPLLEHFLNLTPALLPPLCTCSQTMVTLLVLSCWRSHHIMARSAWTTHPPHPPRPPLYTHFSQLVTMTKLKLKP